jgi:acyl carrier protein
MFIARRVLRLPMVRCYQPDHIVMPRKGGHWVDPEDATKRVMNIVKAHDALKDPSKLTADAEFKTVGFDDLDVVEILLEVERDFFVEFSDDQAEGFKSIQDVVNYVANHKYSDTY